MYNVEYFRSNIKFLKQQVHDQIRLFLETNKISLPTRIIGRPETLMINIKDHIVVSGYSFEQKPIQDSLTLEEMVQLFDDMQYTYNNTNKKPPTKMYAKIFHTDNNFWYKDKFGKVFEVREFVGRGLFKDMVGVGHLEPDQCVAVLGDDLYIDSIIAKEHCKLFKTSIPREQWGVHVKHCCPHFGCKYGDEDCPVAINLVEAQNVCEECSCTPECRLHNPKE